MRIYRLLFIACACGALGLPTTVNAATGTGLTQPVAPVKPVVTEYYGTKVVDPYRYMENLKDPKVRAWMKAQNDYTRAVLARIPGREKLFQRIQQLDQAESHVEATRLPGDRYLLLKQLAGDNVAKLYLRQGLAGKDRLLVDPEKVKLASVDQSKGNNTIAYFAISPDSKYVAVGIVPGGAENYTELHVIETASGRETGDVILHAFFGSPRVHADPLWLPGSHSFVYGRLQKLSPGAPATELFQKYCGYLHALGTDPEKDPAVFGYGVTPNIRVDPRYISNVLVPQGSRYAIGQINSGTAHNSAFYIEPVADLGKTNSAWRKVADFSDGVTDIAVHGEALYLLTFKNAPRFKVVRTDARRPDLATAETVVPPSQAVITSIYAAQDGLYVELMDGAINRLLRVPYGSKPKAEEIVLPFKGALDVETDSRLPGALLGAQTWTKAYRIYSYDPRANRVVDTRLQPPDPHDNLRNIESVEVKARSYDGTLVPLSIVYPKEIKLDGSNPTLMEGYGAYGDTELPQFRASFLAWYENGGVYAVCHVRGGGAYGEEWHRAGQKANKLNSWRDFIACARYLVQHKYTSPAHLAGMAESAGGVLIGRTITARPDLFAAAIDLFGISDSLRYETTGAGMQNIAEFGSVKTRAGFQALYAMSPYAHVKTGTKYPAVFLMAGMNDTRVVPWQLDKMAARLQAATASGKPVLLHVAQSGGHGINILQNRTQKDEMRADYMSFSLWQLGVRGFQPTK